MSMIFICLRTFAASLDWIHANSDGMWHHGWGMMLCYKLKMYRGIDGMFAFVSW